MEDLKRTLTKMKERIKERKENYLNNETATKNQIINPILRSLGWDVEDPDYVRYEEKTVEGKPDYLLFDEKGRECLIIEAKSISTKIENFISQLAKYCVSKGVEYGLITNGAIWILFLTFQKHTSMSEREIWTINIENDDTTAIVRRLSQISKNNISNLKKSCKRDKILEDNWKKYFNFKDPKNIIEICT